MNGSSFFFRKQKNKQTKFFNRKGQLEVSFNWIFVLIAGAAILAFFILITRNEQKSSSDVTLKAVSVKMESLLSSIQQNPDAVQTQDNLNIEIQFKCSEEGHTYSLKGSSATEYLESEILFAPETVGDSKTIAWTQLYSSPYPVSYVLYFTDEKTKYIFIDSGISAEYYTKMPSLFAKEKMTLEQINNYEDQGFRKYIIVAGSADAELINPRQSIRSKTTVVSPAPLSNTVTFIDGQRNTDVSINDVTMFGAIISGDYELYGCTMKKIMQKSRIVGEINIQRVDSIGSTFDPNSKCGLIFSQGLQHRYLSEIIENSIYPGNGNVGALKGSMESLQTLNTQMARANCPTVY